LVAALSLLAFSARVASAHEIPADVTVLAFVKPEPQRLRVLVRIPLVALRDVELPMRGPGFLDLARVPAVLNDAAYISIADLLEVYEGEQRLPEPRLASVRVSLPSDRSFVDYEQALAHVTGEPLPNDTVLYWTQGLLDVLFEYKVASEGSRFAIRPELGRLGARVVTVLRFLPPGGAVRALEWSGNPGLLRLDPSWGQAARQFVTLGFFHILDGTDHLLFLLCLVIPFRRLRALIVVITSFTLALSITLIASAYDLAPGALWVPPLVETLIAVSIVYMALENVVAARLERRWLIAFGFGLVHGFGFSFALKETLQFAGSHLLSSLLSFNLGVELGQLLVVALLVPALDALFRFVVPERAGTIILSALVAHTGWHWMTERWGVLRQYQFQWPELNAAFMAEALRWVMLGVGAAAIAWLVFGVLLKSKQPDPKRINSEV
jgi:hypothetical protein